VKCDKEEQANTSVHGFSLLVPAGWGMPFWQSLVFTGSLIAGYKERRNQCLEAGKPSFPEDYPNTSAGRAYWATRAATDELRWLRKPMSKRLNFARFQGNDTWKPNWHQLCLAQQQALYTAEEEESNGIIPKRFETWLLSAWLAQSEQMSTIANSTVPEVALQQAVNLYREALNLVPIRASSASALYRSCLVRGVLTLVDGGSPKDMAFVFSSQDNNEDCVGPYDY
jgi:ribonuclease P/MRP protein subunit POP1